MSTNKVNDSPRGSHIEFTARLNQFAKEHGFRTKGPLCVALVVTEHARTLGLPLSAESLLTEKEGQVLGLGKAKVQQILGRHGIVRVLAEEGGRTSRGSIDNMREYVALLNELHGYLGGTKLDEIEAFWIGKVLAYFSGKPFSFKLDAMLSLRSAIRLLLRQAEERQRENPGTMYLGTMMQHLVGAKLDVLLGGGIAHHSSNQNDQAHGRTGDFNVGDVSIHVSSAPSEALMRKCSENLGAGLRPLIVTTRKGALVADGLSENIGISARLDVIEFEQFMVSNIYELGRFSPAARLATVEKIIGQYNAIVAANETDPSLQIQLSGNK